MLRQSNVNWQDWHGWTALMHASQEGHAEVVEYLVQTCRANINIRDNAGKRAFERAKSSKIQYILSSAAIAERLRNNFAENTKIQPKKGTLASRLQLNKKPPI